MVTHIVKRICDEGERPCSKPDDELCDEEGARDDYGRDEALFLGDLEAHVESSSRPRDTDRSCINPNPNSQY